MINFNLLITILATVALFLFSIDSFAKQIQKVAGKNLKKFLSKMTSNPVKGSLVGAGTTAVVQSSTATTLITLSLVSAGMISFYSSLGIIIGANVGTTLTTQLIAFKLTFFAPYFILLGFLIGLTHGKYKFLGKPLLYFGLVFFSLSLVSQYIQPITTNPEVISWFSNISNIYFAILVGLIFTAIVQSSSITTGLAVILVGTSLLNFNQALGIILGANIGTTATTLLASLGMNREAKKVAVAHTLFNIIAVLLILPFIIPFSNMIISFGGSPERQIANAHLVFNIGAAIIFLISIKTFHKIILKVYPDKKK